MAPVTRSRRETKTTESPANKKSKASTPKSDSKKPEKRKATEDVTPVAAKKQKATKDTVAAPSPKPTPKTDKSTSKTTPKEDKKSAQKPVKENKKEKKEKPAQKEKKTKEPTPEPEAQEQEDDNEEEEEELDNETQALVENLDGDDKEEDNEEASKQISTFKKGQDVGKIPKKKTRDDKDASATKGSGKRGVMYLGRIPHGFYEHEIRAYFGQFGEITRLRVVRNKKTGASRHRAFVEFADAEVADIAARTMDKYLLFGHILTAKVVPPAQVHKDLFKGANRRFKVIPWNKMAGKQLEKALPESKWQGKITKEEQRRAARAAKLAEMDYEWEAPQLKAAEAKEPALLTAAEEEPVKAIEVPAAAEEKTEEKAETKEEETKEEEEPKSTRKRAAATPKKAAATPKKAAGTTPKKAAATPKAEATTPARATRSTRKTKA
ncbi:uncharacterized protein B0T23DRAFT_360889 [Neurospora hispaniola]|uniref:RRM domain-containing protein n=1 Tax=Neurospora hispaniola TaxID=588809 RepID=A0AAJ0I6Q8_9PEZI|nr:hypothetical protein B0T23DRAFT_360889 [Neurospora hispaniola]